MTSMQPVTAPLASHGSLCATPGRDTVRGFWAYIAPCAVLALGLTALDGMCHLLHMRAGASIQLDSFWGAFAPTFALYLAGVWINWVVIWFLAAFLGGARPGIAFLFTALALAGFSINVNIIDIFFARAMNELWDMRVFIIAFAGIVALAGSIVATLALRKAVRGGPFPAAMRFGASLAGTLLFLNGILLCARIFLPGVRVATALAALTLAVAAGVAMYRWYFRSKRRLVFSNAALVAAALVPVPWAVHWQETAGESEQFTPQSHRVKHVILITIDTLRHDAVTTFDAAKGVTKEIDRVARDGVAFDNAFAAAPWTLPSLASMMTGLSPAVHGAVNENSVLPDRVTTLAEKMRAAGYETAGIGNNFFASPRSKLDQGFREYYWDPVPAFKVKAFDVGLAHWLWSIPLDIPASTNDLTNQAIEWLHAHQQEDFFLWLHYFDPHMPYNPPPEYVDPAEGKNGTALVWNMQRIRNGIVARTAEERDGIRALYRGEVRYVDANVGRLLDALQNDGLYHDALIVITSDHGEEHWDHEGFEHGHTLYNELLRVPLIVKLPAEHKNKRITTYVGTPSLASTILQLCDVPQQASVRTAPSLAPLLNGDASTFVQAPLFAGSPLYCGDKSCVIFDGKKFIHDCVSGFDKLFDLTTDPGERYSILAERPDVALRGRNLIEAAQASAGAAKQTLGLTNGSSAKLDAQDIQTLRAVGYQ